MADPITYEIDGDGVAWATFDDPKAKANVFTYDAMASLKRTIAALQDASRLKAIVFLSGKENIFIAGADIHAIERIESKDKAYDLSREGQKLFDSIANLKVPVLAAIHGACAGGGCELALACHYRLASDAKQTQIGLPEVQLGLIPGWGGCVRLPRLIGLRRALEQILKAQLIPASYAKKLGIVDEVVPAAILKEQARVTALRLIEEGVPARKSHWENAWPMRAIICAQARKITRQKTRGHYPSPIKAIEVVEKALGVSVAEGLELEAQGLRETVVTDACKNLIRVFKLREANRKLTVDAWFPKEQAPLALARGFVGRVGVIGAGVMGSGIAHWIAARGFEVRLRDVKPEFVAKGMRNIADLFQEGIKRRKLTPREAQQGLARVTATTDWSGFENCDLIVEAVIEDIKIKKPVFEKLSTLLRPDAILATNTSAIPIDEIASCATHPGRVIGIHFFNPVSRMPLVEMILGPRTNRASAESALAFVKALGKQIVLCKDSPGFLVNRVLMPYLNAAGHLLMEGNDVKTIDDAMLDFGMPMGPLRLIDEVGIDVAFHVATELAQYLGGRMKVAEVLVKMHEAKLRGRKGGKGFYVHEGRRESVNPELGRFLSDEAAKRALSKEEIIERLVGAMIEEAKQCLDEGVVRTPDDVDFATIMGIGFPPFRGGLMKYAESIGKMSAAAGS